MQARPIYIFAGISGAIAVGMGAFGAHALREVLEPKMISAWEKAVLYQFIHTLALLILPALAQKIAPVIFHWISICWISGSILFSGSIYILVVTNLAWLGPLTPVGGLALIAGWICLIIGAFKIKRQV